MSEDAYEYSGFERSYPKVDDGFYLVKNGITYKVDLPMDKTRFTKRINILTGEVYYPSNFDRIRAMSVEEMAEFFTPDYYDGPKFYCPVQPVIGEGECAMRSDCRQCWLDWLKKEVSTNG